MQTSADCLNQTADVVLPANLPLCQMFDRGFCFVFVDDIFNSVFYLFIVLFDWNCFVNIAKKIYAFFYICPFAWLPKY